MTRQIKYRCDDCEEISSKLLVAKNPFNLEDEINGCPECFGVGPFYRVCEIEGCRRDSSCGGPDKEGVYRMTCGEHHWWEGKKE